MKILTLVVIYDKDKILLGMKKRGFGAGRWNGFGGKVHEGESLHDSAQRELQEEAGIIAHDLQNRGKLLFTFENEGDDLEVNLFSANTFSGELVETDEMKPKWFKINEIPYAEMWADDPFWMPLLLSGKNITGSMHFDNPNNQTILNNSIQEDAR